MGKKNRNQEPKPKKVRIPFVDRPFEGIPFESDLVAMREIIPSATLPVTTTKEFGAEDLLIVTLLPQMAAAQRRDDGVLMVAAQTVTSSGDVSLDIAHRIRVGLELKDGETLAQAPLPEMGPRLQDVLEMKPASMTLYDTFEFWVSADEAKKSDIKSAIEDTRSQMIPTERVGTTEGAFWCRMEREFLRWVRPEEQDKVLDGLARLHFKKECTFDEARFVGAFRALGLLIPVWELQRGAEADELVKPLKAFEKAFAAAIESTEPLSPEERRTRAGIVSRQVTLR